MKSNIVVYVLLLLAIAIQSVHSNLFKLDESNWDLMLNGEWMVEFFAPWCPACKTLEPTWQALSTSQLPGVEVGQIDVTVSPGLSGRFMVTALPTIFHVKNGVFRYYTGARDLNSITTFVKDEKWKQVDPIPGWKSPGSMQMAVLSYFFGLSQKLRTVHSTLMEDYGLPSWGSYLIFAIITIICGAALGMLIVLFLDFFCPASRSEDDLLPQNFNDSGDEDDQEISDEIADEIVDDDETSTPAVRKRKLKRRVD